MIIIGLTGPAGTGKSQFARYGEKFGGIHVDTDRLAKELYFEPHVKTQVVNLLGREVFKHDGSLNKSYLFRKIFFEDGYKNILESILYPELIKKVKKGIERARSSSGFMLIEAVNLFSAGLDELCDFTVGIFSSCEAQVARLEAKGMCLPAVLAVISTQPGLEYYREKCDYLLINEGTQEEFKKQAESFFLRLNDVWV